jgi:hypothetical protein
MGISQGGYNSNKKKGSLGDQFPEDILKIFKVDNTPEDTGNNNQEEKEKFEYRTRSELYINQNSTAKELLKKAIEHVREYDSKETAVKLMNKAYAYCPSVTNKRNISEANKSLKAAIKAEKWKASKRKHKHVRENAVTNNLDTFYDKVATAIESIQVDVEKNSKTFFNKIKKEYHSELPLTLPDSKSSVIKSAPVVIMAKGLVDKKRDIVHMEHSMFLVKDAKLLGVNNVKNKKPIEKAKSIASKKGFVIYEEQLVRPATNITWFLILDFNCYVGFATFPEFLDSPSDEFDLSYSGMVAKSLQLDDNVRSLKNDKLRSIRNQFEQDNSTLIKDIKATKINIENFLEARKRINERFISVTTIDENEGGLDIKFRNRLYKRSMDYRDFLVSSGYSYIDANVEAFRLRVEANTLYYEAEEIKEIQKEENNKLRFLEKMLLENKQIYAEKMGLISLTKYDSLDS